VGPSPDLSLKDVYLPRLGDKLQFELPEDPDLASTESS